MKAQVFPETEEADKAGVLGEAGVDTEDLKRGILKSKIKL